MYNTPGQYAPYHHGNNFSATPPTITVDKMTTDQWKARLAYLGEKPAGISNPKKEPIYFPRLIIFSLKNPIIPLHGMIVIGKWS